MYIHCLSNCREDLYEYTLCCIIHLATLVQLLTELPNPATTICWKNQATRYENAYSEEGTEIKGKK